MASTKTVFKSHLQDVSFVLGNGKFCHFKNGRYLTENEYEIAALTHEVNMGHPHIWIDPEEVECEEKTKEEELADIKKAAIAEFLASQQPALGGIQTSQTAEENSVESTGAPAPSILQVKK